MQKKLKIVFNIIMFLFLSIACSFSGIPKDAGPTTALPENADTANSVGDLPDNQEITPSTTDVTNPNTLLDCEIGGYPCTYDESDPVALERANALLTEAAEMVGESGETLSVATYLESLEDVVEVLFDERVIVFRVRDTAPMIVFHPNFGPDLSDLNTITRRTPKLAQIMPVHAFSDDGPIGPQEAGQNPEKRALLLSLFLWHFKDDEIDEIAALLPNHRDYDCPECIDVVTIADNPLEGISGQLRVGPGVENFLQWDQYDLIHVSTHGTQVCGSNRGPGCLTMILTGGYRSEETIIKGGQNSPYPGVLYGTSPNLPKGWRFEVVTADFFRNQYPGGLSDTLIFFSACKSMISFDLADALTGPNTSVLGWDASVKLGPATEISNKFYEFFVENGLRAKTAFDKTKEFGGYNLGFAKAKADLIIKGSDQPRGREVVTLLDPFFHTELKEGAAITTLGIAGDGENDDLFLGVRVDGIDDDQNPGDFNIHISVDGQEISQTYIPSKQMDEYTFQTGLLTFNLPFDVKNDRAITLEAWVELPEGGETRHFLETVTPVGCGWNGLINHERYINGNEVINTHDAGLASDQAYADLNELGLDGYVSGQFTGNSLAIVMATDDPSGYPILSATDAGGSINLSPGEIYGSQNLDFEVFESGDGLYGTVSGSYLGVAGSLTYSGEFYWHALSRCGFAVKLAAANR